MSENATKRNETPANAVKQSLTLTPETVFSYIQEGLRKDGQNIDHIDEMPLRAGEYIVAGWSRLKGRE